MYIYTRTDKHLYICIHTFYIYTYINIYVFIYIYIYVYVCVCVCVYLAGLALVPPQRPAARSLIQERHHPPHLTGKAVIQ